MTSGKKGTLWWKMFEEKMKIQEKWEGRVLSEKMEEVTEIE